MADEIIPEFLRVDPYPTDYHERMRVLAGIKAILREGDETFGRRTVEFLMGELSRAQQTLDHAKSQERTVQLSPEDARRMRTFLTWPNGSFGGPDRLRFDAVEGGGLLIGVRPHRGEKK